VAVLRLDVVAPTFNHDEAQRIRWTRVCTRLVMASVDNQRRRKLYSHSSEKQYRTALQSSQLLELTELAHDRATAHLAGSAEAHPNPLHLDVRHLDGGAGLNSLGASHSYGMAFSQHPQSQLGHSPHRPFNYSDLPPPHLAFVSQPAFLPQPHPAESALHLTELQDSFSQLDANRDGVIDRREFAKHGQNLWEKQF